MPSALITGVTGQDGSYLAERKFSENATRRIVEDYGLAKKVQNFSQAIRRLTALTGGPKDRSSAAEDVRRPTFTA